METQPAEVGAPARPVGESWHGDALRRVESRFVGHSGMKLFRRAWLPEDPVRAIALVHGFGEHSGRYEHLGAWFAARGSAVHGFDLRGHGRSAGRRGHVDHFADYLNDLEIFLDMVNEQARGAPVTLVGHSMGGLIATAFAVERSPRVQSLVVSGAALALSPDVSRFKIRLARVLRHIAPRYAMDAALDVTAVCSDAEVVRRYVEDPLVHGTTTTAHAVATFDQIDRVRGAGARVEVPVFVTHGAEDRLCSLEGSTRFYQSLPGAEGGPAAPRAELRIYPRSSHEIFNDVEQDTVFADVLDWIERCEEDARSQPE
ncbi:MAG: alpha/beta hydrolase [bacterium]|nr:alpha/beta hydrolase [bacterium]